MGKALKFKTVEDLEQKINAYFESCYKRRFNKETKEHEMVNIRPLTVTGLACALDTSRQVLLDYEGEVEGAGYKDPRYSDAIKKAKRRIECFAEEKLFGNAVIGVIFNMKNNWGWKDKTEVEYKKPDDKLSLDEIDRLENENKDTNNDE